MNVIAFSFDARKAAHAIAYLVHRAPGGQIDKVKLMKLLYLADRNHFLEEGRPITGDDQYAMPFGPVPTLSLDLLDGQFAEGQDGGIFEYVETGNYMVYVKRLPDPVELQASERRVLDAVIEQFGDMGTWELRDYTHHLPEYAQVCRPETSTRIPFELLLDLYSNGRLYRHNRPVINQAMAANMVCPFPGPETDL